VDTIETLYADRLSEQVDRLAHHAFRGEVWGKAVSYLRQAAAKAFARSSNREAVAYFEQALEALKHLPESREALEQGIDLRFELQVALFALGELERRFDYLSEVERLAGLLDDQRRLARASVATSHHFLVTGSAEDARKSGERALGIAQALNDLPLEVAASLYVGAACLVLGDFPQAEGHLGRTVRWLEGDLARQRFGLHGFPAAICHSYLAWILAERGEFSQAITPGREGVHIAEMVDHPYSLAYACWGFAFAHVARGDLSEAARLLERALALCRDWNLPILTPLVSALLGLAHARSGRVTDGIGFLQEAITTPMGGVWKSLNVMWLGEALLLANQLEDARSFANQALALTQDRRHRVCEAWAFRLLGEIASHPDPPDAKVAEDHYRQALALAEELGMRPLAAHCHLGLGMLYQRTGKRQQAQEHLTTAATMYREMDMRFWLEKAEAELKASE
jgi:tetratricopeptide (TPR) repeat protein